MTSLAGVALPGNRKRGFITADTEGYTCSTSSRLTKDAISISWRVPLPSQNPKFTENRAELGHLRCAHGIQPRSQKVRMPIAHAPRNCDDGSRVIDLYRRRPKPDPSGAPDEVIQNTSPSNFSKACASYLSHLSDTQTACDSNRWLASRSGWRARRD